MIEESPSAAVSEELRQKMGEAGRERVKENFSREIVVREYKKKIKELLNK